MCSTQVYPNIEYLMSPSLAASSRNPCKMRRRRSIKTKTVRFSSHVSLHRIATSDHLEPSCSTWHKADELLSMKRRAQKLSVLHHIMTRPGQPKTSRSGIVSDCHPARYEIIGESLRGMEHYTDISRTLERKRVRSDSIRVVEELQNLDTTSSDELAYVYQQRTKKALLYARSIAEEDAKVAATILTEDLKQDDLNGLHLSTH